MTTDNQDLDAGPRRPPRTGQKKRDKRDVHGWVVLDKPVGMTSTHAVAVIRRLFSAKRAGHAGTLDPLASGCLPIALGEATKTVPFIMDATIDGHIYASLAWRKSTYSGQYGECVEFAVEGSVIYLRDSKNPRGTVFRFSRAEWRRFIRSVRESA